MFKLNPRALNISRILKESPSIPEGADSTKAWANPKIIYSILIILLISSISFYLLKEKEKKLRINTEKQLSQAIEEKKVVETKLVGTVKAKEEVEIELSAEKEKSLALKKELEDKDLQITQALDKVEREIAARRKVEAQLMIALKEKDTLGTKVNGHNFASKPVELEKIVIKPGSVLSGKITMVNKDYAFVIVNLGNQHNLKVDDVLSVYRNNKFLGRVKVERADKKMSAAAILPEWQNAGFEENDVVKLL